MANGFSYSSSHEWANLGQGAPEVGNIPDAPPRPQSIQLPLDSLEYAPTTGVKGRVLLCNCLRYPPTPCFSTDLREAVANLYNHTYRQGKRSQYTYENVCIVPGGRAGLSRVAAVIGDVYCVCSCLLSAASLIRMMLMRHCSHIKSQTIPPMIRC